ncbi:hypothetical protein HDV01_000301 [Terramyces sp. JEL0728]|nr:hypothetical protein HDV01_000301 [Terramyces sp. JEL0728]
MQGMFRKQNINIPLHKGSFLPPNKTGEVLMKAYQMSHVGFDYVFVDKPVDGTLFLFASQGQAEIAEDGYGWMDDESYQRFTLENGLEMEIFSRNQGFAIGDTHAVVKRKRYRLVQYSDLQLLHYIRSPMDQTSIPVQLPLIKVRPRAAPPQAMQGSPQQRMPGGMPAGIPGIPGGMANRLTQEQQLQFKKAQQQKLRQTAQVKMVEDDREPSGDELDKGYGRLMALERYKRNHLYIEQVFSPYNVSNLVSPKLFADVSESRMTAIKQHQQELDAELKELQDKYQADIEDFKKKSAAEWKLVHELSLRKK